MGDSIIGADSINTIEDSLESDDSMISEESQNFSLSSKKDSEEEEHVSKHSDDSEDLQETIPSKYDRMKGPFFEIVFNAKGNPQKRQTAAVMKQIGLKPSQARMPEMQLEEYIIIKAVKDYNSSKFSKDML